jgi:hypothetical protein
MRFEDVIKAQEELEQINNQIIENQQETIDLLKKEVDYLRAIVEKYVIKKPLS